MEKNGLAGGKFLQHGLIQSIGNIQTIGLTYCDSGIDPQLPTVGHFQIPGNEPNSQSADLGLAGGVLGGLSGIGNALQSLQARANTIGTTGSYGSLVGDFRLDHQFFRPIADDNTHNGRPLCAVRTLNTLSGYMIIQDGDVAINGTSTEDAQVRNYLETGFYYE